MKVSMESLRGFLTKQRRKRLQRAAAGLMAAAVVFSVYGSLIRPAISATPESGTVRLLGAESSAEPLVIGNSTSSTVTGVYNVSVNLDGDKIEDSLKKYHADLTADFHLTAADVQKIKQEHDNQIVFYLDQQGEDYSIEGAAISNKPVYTSGSSKQEIGTYDFDPTTGKVTIKFDFTKEYFVNNPNGSITGGFNFQEWIWDADNSTEDKQFTIVGNTVKVPIYRYTHSPDLSVNKAYNNDFFYNTPGKDMQGRRMLGSSFRVSVKSVNGIDGSTVTFTDTLKSKNVHFDLAEGEEWPLYDANGNPATDAKLVINTIEQGEGDGEQILTATIVANGDTTFKTGFDYYWDCPVMVNEDYIGENGAVKVDELKIIEGKNSIQAKAKDVPTKSSSADIQVNLIADIAKSNGVYHPEDNTVEWKYTIYKDDGWWRYHKITVHDLIGGKEGGTPPEIVEDSLKLEVVPKGGTQTADYGSAGVTSFNYESASGTFTIEMEKDVDANGQEVLYNGINYNKEPIQEFIVTYKTPVSAGDYNTTIENWVGLTDPDEPGSYNDEDPSKYAVIPKPTISKDYELGKDGITWTITVDNREGMDLGGLSINDQVSASGGPALAGIDFNAGGVIKSVKAAGSAVSTDSVFSDVNGGSLVFKEGSRAESYEIQYFQSIDNISDYSGKTITNKVNISNEDGPLDETEEPADVPKTYEVEKDGYLGSDGKMHYTVSFINLWEADLNELTDKTITDVLTFTRKDGTAVDASKFTVELETPSPVTMNSSASGNTITSTFTINGSNASKRVDVHYTVTPTGGSFTSDYGYTLNNTAEWQDDTDDDVTDIEKIVELGRKAANFIADYNVIEWTFTIYNNYGLDLREYPTADSPFTVNDIQFGLGNITSFKVTDADGKDVTGADDLAAVNTNSTYSFSSDQPMNSKSYTFTYCTKLADVDTPVQHGSKVFYQTNTVSYGNEPPQTVEQPVETWQLKTGISKSGTAAAPDQNGNFIINWKTELYTYYGGLVDAMKKGYKLNDTGMSAGIQKKGTAAVDPNEDVKIYMTESQLDINVFDFRFVDQSTWQTVPLNGADLTKIFELTPTEFNEDGHITGFTLGFKTITDEDSPEYKLLEQAERIEIYYNSTAKGGQLIKSEEMSNGDKLVYKNNAEFPGAEPKPAQVEKEKSSSLEKYYIKETVQSWGVQEQQLHGESSLNLSEMNNDSANEQYILKYRLSINKNKMYYDDEDIVVTDTLPEGLELKSIVYRLAGTGTDVPVTEGAVEAGKITYTKLGDEITFNIPKAVHNGNGLDITYQTVISQQDMNEAMYGDGGSGTAVFRNTAELGDDFDTSELTVTDDLPRIRKSAKQSTDSSGELLNNAVTYTLDINPNALRLLEDGVDALEVKDTINLVEQSGTRYAEYPIYFNQLQENDVRVYKYENGEPVLMDLSEYGASVPKKETLRVSPTTGADLGLGDVYTFELRIPDKTHIKIEYDYSFVFNEDARVSSNTFSDMQLKNQAVINGLGETASNESNYEFKKNYSSGAVAYTMPSITLKKVSSDNWHKALGNAQFELRRYSAETGWQVLTGVEKKTNFYVQMVKGVYDFSKDYVVNSSDFGVWSADGTPYKLETLDTGSSKGTFTLPSLRTTEEVTRMITPEATEENPDPQPVAVTRSYLKSETVGTGDQQKFIYKLTEVKAPTGHYYEEGTKDYYFYELPRSVEVDESTPTAAINSLKASVSNIEELLNIVRADSQILLANNAIDLKAWKIWADPNDKTDEIKVKLFSSKTAPAVQETTHKVTVVFKLGQNTFTEMFLVPDGEKLEATVAFNSESWPNLESSTGLSCETITSIPFTGKFVSDDVITEDVTLQIAFGNIVATGIDHIEQKNSELSSIELPADAVDLEKEITLNAENGWIGRFDTSDLEYSEDTYYYVQEQTPQGFKCIYLNNGYDKAATFRLYNERKKIEVKKHWNDNNSELRPDEIEVELYRSDTELVSDDFHWVDLEVKLGNETYTGLYPVKDGQRLEFDVDVTGSEWINNPSDLVNAELVSTSGENSTRAPLVYHFRSAVVNDDMRVYAYANSGSSNKLKAVTVTNGNALAGTQNEFDTAGLIPVQTLTLSEENGWTAEYDGPIENGAYYYAVEKEVDGYETVYVVNGIDNGVIEIVNNSDNVPRGSITVNKSWLGNEPDTDQITFDIVGYTDKVDQQPSKYSQDAGTYVDLTGKVIVEFTISGQGHSNAIKFVADPDKIYKVIQTGRDYNIYNMSWYHLNNDGSDYRYTNNYAVKNGGSDGVAFSVPTTDGDGDGKIVAEALVNWSEGISDKQYMNPTDDEFLITVLDPDGQEVTTYDIDEVFVTEPVDIADSYEKYTPSLPEGTPVVSKTLTVKKDASSGKWTGTYNGLPLTSGGQPIYYYVVEKDSAAYIPVDYSRNGFVLQENKAASVTVTNQSQDVKAYELPEAGGEGTFACTAGGAALMLTAASLYYIKKRRKAS